jgi:nucleoside-diphosphate-sugar epimerase
MASLPDSILDEAQLDDLLSEPSQACVDMMDSLEGDIIILGVAGKMGVTLAMMAAKAVKRAGANKKVIGVARFSNPDARKALDDFGITTIACDLLDRDGVEALPQAENVIYMAGKKFGTDGDEPGTWAMNAVLPTFVCNHFASSRIVAFSTGCVYELLPPEHSGSVEDDVPAPVGEYAQSCLGRERVFQFYSEKNQTPVCLYRLNYAIDMRYGVLHDIAEKIHNDEPVNINVPVFNIIWQAEANDRALPCLQHCASPASIINITGNDTLKIKDIAEAIGKHMGKNVSYEGESGDKCYISDASLSTEWFGNLETSLDDMVRCQAAWMNQGGRSLGKATHFEVSDGSY